MFENKSAKIISTIRWEFLRVICLFNKLKLALYISVNQLQVHVYIFLVDTPMKVVR